MILFLDPSSSCIGWAMFHDDGRLIDFAKLTGKGKTANDRIRGLAAEVRALSFARDGAEAVNRVVIEDCDAEIGRGARAGGGKGLDVYGKAVGFIWCTLYHVVPALAIEMIPVRKWTRHVAKGKRQMWVAAKYHGRYDPATDPGGDVADAIALGEWWMVERKVAKAMGVGA